MVRRLAALAVVGLTSLSSLGCEPNLDQRTFAVTSSRVLAVRSEPAEATPGTKVALTTLYVGPSGPLSSGPFDWAYCNAQNPLANLGPVNPECYASSGSGLLEIGDGASESSPVPLDACRLFGPDVPATVMGEPPGRPVAPDTTGGYYQPVRLVAGAAVAVGMVRITCDVPGATPDQVTELTEDNHPNQNPQIDALEDPTLGTLSLAGMGTNRVSPSQRLVLTVSWAVCDTAATSCSGSEGYAFLDPETHAVVQAREEIRVAWFATGGSFDNDATGRPATDPTPNTENGWTAPSAAGTVYLWLVIRDDRGGAGWRSYVIEVE